MPRGPGIHTPLKSKAIYDPDELAESVACAITSGQSLNRSPMLGPVTEYDRRQLARITGETVDQFNDRLAQKLRVIADKAADRIEAKLDGDNFKTSELAFVLSVAHDKRLTLDGSRALQNASVNIQVNNYGSAPKDSLLADLDGLSHAKRVTASPALQDDCRAEVIVSPSRNVQTSPPADAPPVATSAPDQAR